MTNLPLTVLLIDDNRSDRALAIRELRRAFAQLQIKEIREAREFEQVLDADAFDAVITDYQLGWSNGLEILRAIKARYPDCPIVMFTNTGSEEIAVEALKSGLDDYILKEPNRYVRLPASVQLALERKKNERRAALVELRLQSLLNRLDVGVFRATSEGVLLESNPALVQLLGVSSIAEAQSLLQPYLQKSFQSLANLSSPEPQECEIEFRRTDGMSIWTTLSLTFNTIDGEMVLEGLLNNITERKRAELEMQQVNQMLEERVKERTAELESANGELRQVNQELEDLTQRLSIANQELEEFANSVSHDLRAPLRIIAGMSQMLLEERSEQLDALSSDLIQRIIKNAQQTDRLIIDLLSYSRMGQTKIPLQPINLSFVVTDVLRRLEPELERQQVLVTVEEPLPRVMGNSLILSQVFTNLLTNAVKFVAKDTHPRVRLWAEVFNEWTRIWVEDNGIGITAENLQRIFRVFERLHSDEEYPGTGIGLGIVRKGIERIGGRVGVESQPGRGSQFWIELLTYTESP